jgi:hypothetical protein
MVLLGGMVSMGAKAKPLSKPLNVDPPHISTDKSIKYDYDIVYVRAPRFGDNKQSVWAEAFHPAHMDAGADLMLLHPDGSEEVLVRGGKDSVVDPMVSFDGAWVYFAKFHDVEKLSPQRLPEKGADIYKIHVKSRKVVQLTQQRFAPNTGVNPGKFDYGVLNLGPCPLPGGRVMFTSNRHGFLPPKGFTRPTLQLCVMDDDGANLETIGFLNIGSALHPTMLRDGRVMFSSYESQGLRDLRMWSIWTINPDGTNWGPLVSNLSFVTVFHFMTQLSDGRIVVEEYYNLNNSGFGTYHILPDQRPDEYAPFGPGYRLDPRNPPVKSLVGGRMSFSPYGIKAFTPFVTAHDAPAPRSNRNVKDSPYVGKFTHPSGAPDNHMLTVWSPGPVNHNNGLRKPALDSGLYLIKGGKPIDEPGQMLLIKNDPKYNEQWPRALVPYKRIYDIDEPKRIPPFRNNGQLSRHLPEGTPFGLVGTSSLYKRESFPNGVVRKGTVTASNPDDKDPYQGLERFSNGSEHANWFRQGSDAGRYNNSDIHAIRIVVFEAATDRSRVPKPGRLFYNFADERMRILGEIPVRKFNGNRQPTDPDGNPDTSFLAKIPADVAWTFQTLDKDGMVLNIAQTWHQLRPGEIRNDCGGCHAHSQKPTLFAETAAAKSDYAIFDLTKRTPLLTDKTHDQSHKKWDAKDETGLRYERGVKNVEYHRDIRPIFQRSCATCHSKKLKEPAAKLVLDDDTLMKGPELIGGYIGGPPGKVPGTYFRLALDPRGNFGNKPIAKGWNLPQASRYIRMFQSRRSLLMWKVLGRRTDGWSNDDFPTERVPGDPSTLELKGKPVANTPANRARADLDYTGSIMPPPSAVAGTYAGPEGKKVKVSPLTDEDRRNLARWIDLGCPIDLDYDPSHPSNRGKGWMLDEVRPTLTLSYPHVGANEELSHLLVGMHDFYTGLDMKSFQVVADFTVDGVPAGRNLVTKFKEKSEGVWELKLSKPITKLARGKVTVSVADREGNINRIERTFSVAPAPK